MTAESAKTACSSAKDSVACFATNVRNGCPGWSIGLNSPTMLVKSERPNVSVNRSCHGDGESGRSGDSQCVRSSTCRVCDIPSIAPRISFGTVHSLTLLLSNKTGGGPFSNCSRDGAILPLAAAIRWISNWEVPYRIGSIAGCGAKVCITSARALWGLILVPLRGEEADLGLSWMSGDIRAVEVGWLATRGFARALSYTTGETLAFIFGLGSRSSSKCRY